MWIELKQMSLDEFLEYLPKLNDEQHYLFYLISRDKEVKEELGVNIDKVLFRLSEVNPSRAVHIMNSVREVSNVFTVRGMQVKKEWVKIMFVLNPVNFVKASRATATKFVQQCCSGTKLDIMKIYNSEISRSIDFRIFMIDVDNKSKEIIEQMKGLKARLVITTKRGFHIHIWKEDITDPRLLFKIKGVEVKTRDSLEYVPFVNQGSFTPIAYRIDDAGEVTELL
ncbi:hypothetical protein [Sulfuracidifex metallicus]|uniref:hypothetical protein n=1 Tax=Sulfuracidifex metallicus TaxID=47303 RepID=UPI002274DDB6|nr:hypothetical protein [Sulfuracidifex metallicus]MCY0849734.1 hypothetical protein [Sulfuracidifex metallicus]